MPSNPISSVQFLSPDILAHQLGYPDRPTTIKAEEIKASMRDIKNWLDGDADTPASTTTQPSPRRRTDSCTCCGHKPVVLIASTGSIRRKRRVTAAQPLPTFIPSDNAGHLASVKYEPRSVAARPEGLESFPRLVCPPSPRLEKEYVVVRVEEKSGVGKWQGIVSKLKYFFNGGGEDIELVYKTAKLCI